MKRRTIQGYTLDEDTRLMLKAAGGDKTAYARLYKKYFAAVVSFVLSLGKSYESPQDIAQDVFARIWQHRGKYRPAAAFRTYLFGCAKNVLRESQFKTSREKALGISDFSLPASSSSQSSAINYTADTIEKLKKLIAQLPDKQRQTFELVYVSSYSASDAARILHCSAQSIYSNLHRARKELRRLMNGSYTQTMPGKQKLSARKTKMRPF